MNVSEPLLRHAVRTVLFPIVHLVPIEINSPPRNELKEYIIDPFPKDLNSLLIQAENKITLITPIFSLVLKECK
tara:strand:- start:294 stop:515 length:222 start_codon:yes stop_codon:yes gene_type:complete